MSRLTTAILPLAVPAGVGGIIFSSAGRWDLPFVWAILCILAVFYLALAAFADLGMMRERLAPGPGNQDRLTRSLGGAALVGHWVLAGLDVGRFHWDGVPWEVQVACLVGYAAALGVLSGRCVRTRSTRPWFGCKPSAGIMLSRMGLTGSSATPATQLRCSPC